MIIGIVVAMEEELESVTSLIENFTEISTIPIPVLENNFYFHKIYLTACGIGKANAAMGATLLINKYQADLIVNIGIAAGIQKHLRIGEVVLSETAVYFDVDVSIFGYKIGQVPRMPSMYMSVRTLIASIPESLNTHHAGIVCTGDSFLASQEKIDNHVTKIFPDVMALEMEGAAIAQVCHCHNIPFLLIKGISDKGDENSPADSEKNIFLAMNAAVNYFKSLLDLNVFKAG